MDKRVGCWNCLCNPEQDSKGLIKIGPGWQHLYFSQDYGEKEEMHYKGVDIFDCSQSSIHACIQKHIESTSYMYACEHMRHTHTHSHVHAVCVHTHTHPHSHPHTQQRQHQHKQSIYIEPDTKSVVGGGWSLNEQRHPITHLPHGRAMTADDPPQFPSWPTKQGLITPKHSNLSAGSRQNKSPQDRCQSHHTHCKALRGGLCAYNPPQAILPSCAGESLYSTNFSDKNTNTNACQFIFKIIQCIQ